MQNRKPSEIILHVGRLTSLQSWVAKKSCHGQTLINMNVLFLTTLPLTTFLMPQILMYFGRKRDETVHVNWQTFLQTAGSLIPNEKYSTEVQL